MKADAIAVIGMAGRFPGAADVRAFWNNLSAGRESIHFFTDDELRAAGEAEEALADPRYVKACGRLEGIDMFDAGFFGFSPRDAAIFDPQHRLFLECAWEAFEHAGYVGEAAKGPVGVFASSGMSEYMFKNVLTNPEIMATVGEWMVRHTGNDPNFLATRVSYELDLRGPSVSVQTACSSSLVAIHMACQSLLSGECDLALAGGATVYPEQNKGYFWREGEIFSVDGHTRSFDASATGMTLSSGVGCVVLKRLSDAERDCDNVLAIVRGSAVNNDGHDKVGYFAPSVAGQARAVTEALGIAGASAEEISYVEAHGTATAIGDPIEIAGLTQAFRAFTGKTGYCAIGSLKSSIGHTGEASGVAAFIKLVLALEHRQIPPSLHYESPNPRCEFPSSPFFVNTELRPWEATPRIAGVTSLGVGGTNCHAVLEEAPARPTPAPSRDHQLLVVSAKTKAALDMATKNLARQLADEPGAPLADVAYTLTVGRKGFRHRRAIVAKDAREAVRAIAAMDSHRVFTDDCAGKPRTTAFLFADGDAHYAGMARDLYHTERAFTEAADTCLALLRPHLKRDLGALMFLAPGRPEEAGAAKEALGRPSLALPALFTIEYAMARLLVSWGITPSALLGQGAGEYTAACLAGVMSVQDALGLVAARGLVFETVAPSGAVDAPILAPFAELCRTVRFERPRIPLLSSKTGTWLTDAQSIDPQYWVDQLHGAVRIDECLRSLLEDQESVLVEVGPGLTSGSLARQERRPPLATMRRPGEQGSDMEFLLASLGRMWAAGEVELSALYEGQARRRIPLPTYPWQRQRYWLMPGTAPTAATPARPAHASASLEFERPELDAMFLAPRTPVERELAAMWRELLGVDRVGVRDDFFELGGQSVIAVQFVGRIRKTYGVNLPLSTLLEAPTIEGCAALVSAALGVEPAVMRELANGGALGTTARDAVAAKSSTGAPTREFHSLVPIQRGDGRRPFFCVHGAGGNVLNFRDLSRALCPEQPFYGLQARGIDGVLRPHETVEEMAAAYLEEIRALQPHGPYMLGGYSGGGLAALEVARLITDAGEAVDLLALIDTFHPAVPVRKMTLAMRLERTHDEGFAYFRRGIEGQISIRRTRRQLAQACRFVSKGEPIPPELRECYLVQSFEKAVARYRPRPWQGRAILFRAEDTAYIYGDASPAYGWEGIIAQIAIVRVPGNHHNLLLERHGSVLIERLGRAIEEASPSRIAATPAVLPKGPPKGEPLGEAAALMAMPEAHATGGASESPALP